MASSNNHLLLQLSFLLTCTHFSTASAGLPALIDRYILRAPASAAPQEYLDPTFPPILLPSSVPSCSLPLLSHDFAYTYGLPPVTAPYAPPADCPWARVVLDLSIGCAGEQYDRIAAVWLDGAEILRTSTAEPTEPGVFWRVRKDVTRYASLLRRENGSAVSMMLENLVNDVFTGIYHVNVSLDFYKEEEEEIVCTDRVLEEIRPKNEERLDFSSSGADNLVQNKAKVPSLYGEPADMIIPISNNGSETGFWFKIKNESNVHSKRIMIPANAHRAVLEIYVSFHQNDEFWYSNPPNSYIEKNNLTTGRGNGAFREVFATIDGRYVGSIVPFPVIFTGGINPLFWAPVVALGAFDLPSYFLDMTPFLGLLLDGKPHDFGLGISDGIDIWLVDANLHLWLDPHSSSVTAELVHSQVPDIYIARSSEFNFLNGTFKIEAGRKSHFSGWVNSSLGNLTIDVHQKLKFKNLVEFKNDGNYKAVHFNAKVKMDVKIRKDPNTMLAQGSHKYRYPLVFVTSTLPGENDTYIMQTNLSHSLSEKTSVIVDKVINTSSLTDRQSADGWMLVQDHSVLDGSAGTQQSYHYRDNGGYYFREISVRDGLLVSDNTTSYDPFASL